MTSAQETLAVPTSERAERETAPNGGAMAALLAAGIGSFALGLFVILNEAGIFAAPSLYGPAGGVTGRTILRATLVLIAVGLDPVELLPRPWAWPQPVVHCTRWAPATSHIPAGETIIGDIAHALREIDDALSGATDWTLTEVAEYRERQRGAVTTDGVFTPGAAAARWHVTASCRRPARSRSSSRWWPWWSRSSSPRARALPPTPRTT